MLWLDGLWPRDSDPEVPGHLRGDCAPDSGNPDEVIANNPDAYVHPHHAVLKETSTDIFAATSPGPTSASDPLARPLVLKPVACRAVAAQDKAKGGAYRSQIIETIFMYIFARFSYKCTLSISHSS